MSGQDARSAAKIVPPERDPRTGEPLTTGTPSAATPSLVCPICGWLYGKKLVVPSHTRSVRWGANECEGAGMEGISQRERMERGDKLVENTQ